MSNTYSYLCFGYNFGSTGIEYTIRTFTMQFNYDKTNVKISYISEGNVEYFVEIAEDHIEIRNSFSSSNIYYIYLCMIPIFSYLSE